MKFSRGLNKMTLPPDSGVAIRLGDSANLAEENRAGFFLVLYMRLLAGLWVWQGLLQWSAILLPAEPMFDTLSTVRGAAVIFFAIFDLVAAVGLWLAAPWGGAIWLLGAIAQIFVTLGLPGFFSLLWIGANSVLILIYFFLTWQAARADELQGRRR